MNYLHNSQNGLDNITKKTFHQRHKMLLETIMVHLKVIPIMRKKDEDLTAQDVDPEAQEGGTGHVQEGGNALHWSWLPLPR